MLCFSVFFFLCFLAHFRLTSGGIVGMPWGGIWQNRIQGGSTLNVRNFLKKQKGT